MESSEQPFSLEISLQIPPSFPTSLLQLPQNKSMLILVNNRMTSSVKKLISAVILDLDATLVNTDAIVSDVMRIYLTKHGKLWDGKTAQRIVGKTPYEAASAVVQDYQLSVSTDQLLSEVTQTFHEQCCNMQALPGANRLISHLRGHGVLVALAPNSPKENIMTKILHKGWTESFPVVLGSAKRLHVDPSSCLSSKIHWIENTLPVGTWYVGGPVIKGFRRGSKMLGIPTANISTEGYSAVLSEYPPGVYFGWTGLQTHGVYKMVMSIGWNPCFNNAEKTIEQWLLHDFSEDFYGKDLHLVIVGYIRPEMNFSSLESLIAKIHEDKSIAEKCLELPLYHKYKADSYLQSSSQDTVN